jgi:hypothetical protein
VSSPNPTLIINGRVMTGQGTMYEADVLIENGGFRRYQAFSPEIGNSPQA